MGGQAEKDGLIQVEDEIVAIDQIDTTAIDDVGTAIRDSGPTVTLTVRRVGNI